MIVMYNHSNDGCGQYCNNLFDAEYREEDSYTIYSPRFNWIRDDSYTSGDVGPVECQEKEVIKLIGVDRQFSLLEVISLSQPQKN